LSIFQEQEPGASGDVVQGDPEAVRGEDVLRGVEDPLPVAGRVLAHRLLGGVDSGDPTGKPE
jgi:hypothetical protein